ncbi:MAG: hypothetical protein QOH35_6078 [Acidobacteriaceae bacterium]|jgi:hypothetical protein|nr:hypothetical protein [Acidobacteriaceae bacterium]MEA2544712.1 hypothetical protein [Acidobacteriaceae bacterium]
MPKNTVTDPITDQEMAFAHLIMSGTMNDRRAAEAVGLNPETAAYTKAKPRVRAYMIEHRAAVEEKLVDQEAQGLRKLNLGRDQILTRLWELATLSHEATRGTIAGQIKALSMIVAIEGMVPDRRFSSLATRPAAPPVEPDNWLPNHQHQPASEERGAPVAVTKTQPAAPQVANPKSTSEPAPKSANGSFPDLNPKPTSPLNPFIKSHAQNHVPTATGITYDAVLDPINPIKLSFSPNGLFSGRRR